MSNFNTESLIRAMHLPVDEVILNFKSEKLEVWHTESAQAELASIITRIVQPRTDDNISFEPATRYIRKLVQSYARLIEDSDSKQIENDDLVEIMMDYQFRSRQSHVGTGSTTLDENVPNPMDSCYVSFVVPTDFCSTSFESTNDDHANIVGIKIYPHHNDVGVQKVWEAGAALSEFLIANRHYVQNKTVCELGAGVGLTGLVIAGVCQTKQVHMTDYTNATLENLEHNCVINKNWILQARSRFEQASNDVGKFITTGHLEWDEFQSKDLSKISLEADRSCEESSSFEYNQKGNGENSEYQYLQPSKKSLAIAMNSDVIIAADVVYDRSVIPQLIQVVRNILSVSKQKIAIFATTYRNADTFALFQNEIERSNDHLVCNFIDSDVLESMPYIFPCYYRQPRSHVRICIISVKQ